MTRPVVVVGSDGELQFYVSEMANKQILSGADMCSARAGHSAATTLHMRV